MKSVGLNHWYIPAIFTLIFTAAWKLIQLVTSQGCFGRAKMAANFGLNQPTSNGLKSSFQGALAKKKLAVFVSEVETLLLGKNLRYENFVSVAL